MIKKILRCVFRLVRPALNGFSHRYILFEFLPIGRYERDGVVVGFAEGRVGEGLVCIAEVRFAAVQHFACVSAAIDMLVLKFSLLKSPATIKAASGYMVSSLHSPVKFFQGRQGIYLAGIYTAVNIIEEKSLGRQCGRHLIVRNFKSAEQKDLSSYMLL